MVSLLSSSKHRDSTAQFKAMSSDDDDWMDVVVIDNGSGSCQSGFAGEDAPRSIFPLVVGRRREGIKDFNASKSESFVGDQAVSLSTVLSLRHPIERGVVTDWDAMETIWHHVFETDLKTKSEDMKVLMTDTILNPAGNREKMTEVLMETFHVPGFHVKNQGILSVYGSGRGSTVTVNIGDGVIQVFVIYEGMTVLAANRRLDLAGRDLTLYLQRLLYDRGYSFTTHAEMKIVEDMKEKLCFVSQDYKKDQITAETTSYLDKSYTLPDGSQITLGHERFQCPEALFQPCLIGLDCDGIHQQINECILECGLDMRRLLYSNIVLSGGTTMCPGLADRLELELRALVPRSTRVKILAPPERKFLPWIGGSIIGSLSTFQHQWITQEVYQEAGPGIVHQRCANV
uniref:Actin n=1 Tax=Magallana gigas TaxID=29159 RepID=A0A8W8JZV4_MAGGI